MVGELSSGPPSESTHTVDDIAQYFEHQAANSTDRYEQMLSLRIGELLCSDKSPLGSQIKESLQLSINKHPFYRTSDHTRSYMRALSSEQIWLSKHNFIKNVIEPSDFDSIINDAYATETNGIIFNTFLSMNVLSNVTDRAKFVKLEAILGSIRLPMTVVELGASQMLNGRKLELHMTKPSRAFPRIEVVAPHEQDNGSIRYRPVKPESAQLDTIVRRLGYSQAAYVGLDELDPRDSLVGSKAEGDSFMFAERALGSPRLTEFNILRRLHNLPGHHYYYADCSKPIDTDDFFRYNPEVSEGADLAFLSFVLYEIPPADRATLIENARRIINPKTGRIMVIDNVRIRPDGGMVFPDKQDAYSTTVTVFDNARPDLGWQHRYTLETGRGNRFVIESSIGNLAVARQLSIKPSRPSSS